MNIVHLRGIGGEQDERIVFVKVAAGARSVWNCGELASLSLMKSRSWGEVEGSQKRIWECSGALEDEGSCMYRS